MYVGCNCDIRKQTAKYDEPEHWGWHCILVSIILQFLVCPLSLGWGTCDTFLITVPINRRATNAKLERLSSTKKQTKKNGPSRTVNLGLFAPTYRDVFLKKFEQDNDRLYHPSPWPPVKGYPEQHFATTCVLHVTHTVHAQPALCLQDVAPRLGQVQWAGCHSHRRSHNVSKQ